MASATRKLAIFSTICIIVAFAAGILIGYFAIERKGDQKDGTSGGSKMFSLGESCKNEIQNFTYLNSFIQKCNQDICDTAESVCDHSLPHHYIAYHLNGKSINIDGHLDDEAWQEVPWSSELIDIRGVRYPKPRFDTKFKLRWDDNRLYVAALLDETDLWATFTQDENLIWQDNAFEVFYDADNSMQNYKELEINALNTTWDLMLTKAYIDCPDCLGSNVVSNWTSNMEKAVHYDGEINNPNVTSSFWSVEWSFTFAALAEYTRRTNPTPSDGEVLFMQFARAQWKLEIKDGQYQKVKPEHADWWSWQPTGAVALHLPNRWGAVQFSKNLQNKKFEFSAWRVYKALFDVFDALQAFNGLNGMYITDLHDLEVPPYLLSGKCIDVPTIQLRNRDGKPDFVVTVKSKTFPQEGHIRSDRYTWFGPTE